MNYATGQMASIVRLVSTDPYQPFDRVVRTVPVLQRAPWRPWPWRLWGGPSLAYGRSMADYPYMQPYADMRSYGWDMYATGQAAPADVRAAAGTAIRHSQPPPWAPTVAHQPAHNRAVGPIGGLGTSAAAGYAAAHQSDILAGTSIDPRLAAAVEQLGVVLQGRQGIVAITDNASRPGIDVFALPVYLSAVQRYVERVLMGAFMGFSIAVRPSAPIVLQ